MKIAIVSTTFLSLYLSGVRTEPIEFDEAVAMTESGDTTFLEQSCNWYVDAYSGIMCWFWVSRHYDGLHVCMHSLCHFLVLTNMRPYAVHSFLQGDH